MSPGKNLKGLPAVAEKGPDKWETAFESAVAFFPGKREEKNLAEFKKLLVRLQTLGVKDLQGMVSTIGTLRSEEARIPAPPAEAEREKVQLMTVHAAKGLEFPFVFLCDVKGRAAGVRQFVSGDGKIHLQTKDRSAPGLKARFEKSASFTALEEIEKKEEREESKRLLYVALTRASEGVILALEEPAKTTGKGEGWFEWLQ